MRSVSVRLADLQRVTIPIGYVGENLYTKVIVDCKKEFDEHPTAVVGMTVEPPEGDPYPAVVTRDGDFVVWEVSASDLVYKGAGNIQISFTVDGTIVGKSPVGRIMVNKSIEPSGEVPTSLDDFLTRASTILNEIPDDIATALEAAKESGEFDGADGYSPTVTVTEISGGHQITITDAEGDHIFTVMDGADGQDGQRGQDGNDGVSPTVSVSDITGGHRVTIVDAEGTHTFDVMDGQSVDPTSIIDDTSEAENKVWSAKESASLKSALSFVKGDGSHSAVVEGEYYGYANDADADFSVAHGVGSSALGKMSHAEGLRTIAVGQGAHSEGVTGCAIGSYSHTEGGLTLGIGYYAHSEGYGAGKELTLTGNENATTYNVVSGTITEEDAGYGARVFYKNKQIYVNSVDTVNRTITLASSFGEALSNAVCILTFAWAYGSGSHTEGTGTIARGSSVHAEGVFNVEDVRLPSWTANTSYSIGDRVEKNSAGYICIEANSDSAWDSSKWAFSHANTKHLLMVGNGYNNINRSNAFAVDVYGNGKFNGDIYAGCNADSTGGTKVALVSDINPVVDVSGSTPSITAVAGTRYICGEVSTLTIVVPASGCIDVTFESGSTATVLTITPPTGKTVKWANGFDPTALEANTTYELNIMDCKGVAGSWT